LDQKTFLPKIKEPFNGITHICGALLSVIGLVVLVCRAATEGSAWHVVSFAIYGISLIALYTASSLYHSLHVSTPTNDILRQLDHAMIYLLIAGTYTPFCLVVLRGAWGWTLLGINWTLAIVGIILKLTFRNPPRLLTIVLFTFFIIMGWLIVVAWSPLVKILPKGGMTWLIAGGIFYTLGAGVLSINRLKIANGIGAHEVWHLFVMAGSFCHFWVMLRYVLYLP